MKRNQQQKRTLSLNQERLLMQQLHNISHAVCLPPSSTVRVCSVESKGTEAINQDETRLSCKRRDSLNECRQLQHQ